MMTKGKEERLMNSNTTDPSAEAGNDPPMSSSSTSRDSTTTAEDADEEGMRMRWAVMDAYFVTLFFHESPLLLRKLLVYVEDSILKQRQRQSWTTKQQQSAQPPSRQQRFVLPTGSSSSSAYSSLFSWLFRIKGRCFQGTIFVLLFIQLLLSLAFLSSPSATDAPYGRRNSATTAHMLRQQQADATAPAPTCDEHDEYQLTLAVEPPYPTYPLSSFLKGPGLDHFVNNNNNDHNTTTTSDVPQAAVCEWYVNSGTNHFPHEMEQLYRCWSYWNQVAGTSSSDSSTTTPIKKVLYRPKNAGSFRWYYDTFRYSTYRKSKHDVDTFVYNGLLPALQNVFDVEIVTDDDVDTDMTAEMVQKYRVRKGDWTTYGGYGYRMANVNDARALAEGIHKYYKLPVSTSCSSQTTTTSAVGARPRPPRVAILNRQPESKRSILNAVSLAKQLEEHFSDNQIYQDKIDVVHFESTTTFQEQVRFFASTDLVITPHGAQLTASVFLPNTCASILEIFPKYYYYQAFYGSLAESSGHKQYTMYPTTASSQDSPNNTTTITQPQDEWQQSTRAQQRLAKNQNLCVSFESVRVALERMLHDWHGCCQQQQEEVVQTERR